MLWLGKRICGGLVMCALVAGAAAQAPQEPQTSDMPAVAGPIRLNVVVVPQGGRHDPVPGLPESAFSVLDNGKPQAITSFKAFTEEQAPVKVILVVDDVNIAYTRLAYERNQLEQYLHGSEGKLTNPTMLGLVTDTSIELTPQFTTDGNELGKALDDKEIGLRDLRRDSGFYGAQERLQISLRAFGQIVAKAATIPGRKAIVWISPGWPLLSGPAVQLSNKQQDGIFHEVMGFSAQMRHADVTLYSVDPLGAGQGPLSTYYYEEFVKAPRKVTQTVLGNLGLQVLAIQSGGQAVSSSNDVAALIAECVADTKAYYELTFAPPPPDAPEQFHEIDVKVNEAHLIARTRQGYYAQP